MGGVADTTSSTFTPPSTIALGTSEAPAVIVLAGLQGSGKTTTAARLALYLKEREVDYANVTTDENSTPMGMVTTTTRQPRTERKVLLAAADVYRPAAIKQLQVLADSINVEVFSIAGSLDPVDIATRAVGKAKQEGYDTVLIDTAGRQVIDEELMEEIRQIKSKVRPVETLLVVDAMTGQEAATLTML
jgi:signal recognition particle subunit SRP54